MRALHGNAALSRYPIRDAGWFPLRSDTIGLKRAKFDLSRKQTKSRRIDRRDLLREVPPRQRTVCCGSGRPRGTRPTPHDSLNPSRESNQTQDPPQQMEEPLREFKRSPSRGSRGDLNTTGSDSTPTSVENMLYKRYGDVDFWTTKGVQWATGAGIVYTGAKALRSLSGIQYQIDPTSKNIPGVHPNQERGFFTTVERFRFADGHAFDFRGVPNRTANEKSGTLGDSNERGSKGFAPTFVSELIWGKVRVAKFKLDWIFVKSNLNKPRDPKGSYLFAPHFPRTMYDLNNCLPDPSPITVP